MSGDQVASTSGYSIHGLAFREILPYQSVGVLVGPRSQLFAAAADTVHRNPLMSEIIENAKPWREDCLTCAGGSYAGSLLSTDAFRRTTFFGELGRLNLPVLLGRIAIHGTQVVVDEHEVIWKQMWPFALKGNLYQSLPSA